MKKTGELWALISFLLSVMVLVGVFMLSSKQPYNLDQLATFRRRPLVYENVSSYQFLFGYFDLEYDFMSKQLFSTGSSTDPSFYTERDIYSLDRLLDKNRENKEFFDELGVVYGVSYPKMYIKFCRTNPNADVVFLSPGGGYYRLTIARTVRFAEMNHLADRYHIVLLKYFLPGNVLAKDIVSHIFFHSVYFRPINTTQVVVTSHQPIVLPKAKTDLLQMEPFASAKESVVLMRQLFSNHAIHAVGFSAGGHLLSILVDIEPSFEFNDLALFYPYTNDAALAPKWTTTRYKKDENVVMEEAAMSTYCLLFPQRVNLEKWDASSYAQQYALYNVCPLFPRRWATLPVLLMRAHGDPVITEPYYERFVSCLESSARSVDAITISITTPSQKPHGFCGSSFHFVVDSTRTKVDKMKLEENQEISWDTFYAQWLYDLE